MINKRSITLLELLVVFAILGIITAIAIPNFLYYFLPNIRLSQAGNELVENLRTAQQLTVTQQVPHTILFKQAENSYQMIRNYGQAEEEILKTINLPTNISYHSISLSPERTTFNFAGTPSPVGNVIIQNENNKTKTIEITPSGFIKVD